MFFIMLGFINYYLLSLLLLENGGVGPRLFCKKRRVLFYDPVTEELTEWLLTWVDCLRRVFNVYEVRFINDEKQDKISKVWYVRDNQMSQLWSCPLCLGFWTSLILTLLIIYSRTDILNIFFETDILNTFFEADILSIISNLLLITLSSTGVGVFLYDITAPEEK